MRLKLRFSFKCHALKCTHHKNTGLVKENAEYFSASLIKNLKITQSSQDEIYPWKHLQQTRLLETKTILSLPSPILKNSKQNPWVKSDSPSE